MKTTKKILFTLTALFVLAIAAAAVVFNFSDLLQISPIAFAALAPIAIPKTAFEARSWAATYLEDAGKLHEKAKNEKRDLTPTEKNEFDQLMKYHSEMNSKIRDLELSDKRNLEAADDHFNRMAGISQTRQTWVDREGRSIPVFSKNESFVELIPLEQRGLSLGKAIVSMIRGDWRGAENEQRALSSAIGSGGVTIPIELYANIVDRARAKSVIFAAGAQLVNMASSKLTIARVNSDPVFSVKAENAAFSESDMSFDSIELTAHTIGTYFTASRELLADAPNASAAIELAIVNAFAEKLDSLALTGTGTGQPLGLLHAAGVSSVDFSSFSPLGYAYLVRLWHKILAANGTVSGFVMSPRELAAMALERSDLGAIDLIPNLISKIPIIASTSVPTNLGVTENEGICFAGDFSQMLVGLRQNLEIEISTTSGDNFQKHAVGIKAVWRGDIGLVRPNHFAKGVNIGDPFIEA